MENSNSLILQILLSYLNEDVRDAVSDVGGSLEGIDCAFDYPDAIRDQLIAMKVILDSIKAGKGIKVTAEGKFIVISANSEATMVSDINSQDGEIIVPVGSTIQEGILKLIDWLPFTKNDESIFKVSIENKPIFNITKDKDIFIYDFKNNDRQISLFKDMANERLTEKEIDELIK